MTVEHWDDLRVTVRITPHENRHSVGFDVLAMTPQPDGSRLYGDSLDVMTSDYEKAPVWLHGFIKWDGCSHWSFPTDEESDCAMHVCGFDEAVRIGRVFARLFERAQQAMPETHDPARFAARWP